MKYFCINLTIATPCVVEFDKSELEDLAKELGKSILDLSNFDCKVFSNEAKAKAWLDKYNEAKAKLSPLTYDADFKTSILYKRRYLIQTVLGEKLYTERNSKKSNMIMDRVKVGENFRLYDQKYQVIVKLTKKTKLSNGFRYEFEAVK